MSKTKKKTARVGGVRVWVILLIVALSVGATCGVMKLTDNLSKGVNELVYNQDNLIRTLEEYEGKEGNAGNGLVFTVYDSKAIHVKGKINDSSSSVEWQLGEIVITEDGEYTLSGMKNASLTTAHLKGTYTDTEGNERTFYGDINDSMTVELVEGTRVTLSIVIYAETDIDTTVKPTFVLGDEAGKF